MEPTPGDSRQAAEDASLLRKQIGTARTFLLIVTAITMIAAILLTPTLVSPGTTLNLVITLALAIIYGCLAIWTKKRPYTAVCIALLVLLLAVAADIFVTPFGPYNHWQSKLLTLLLLLLGLGDSRDAQRKMLKAKA